MINLAIDPATGQRFRDFTRDNRGRVLAIALDDQVISQAKIMSEIGERLVITGNFTQQQVDEIVAELAGAKRAVPASQPASTRPAATDQHG